MNKMTSNMKPIELNNHGAALLDEGRLEEAASAFKGAFKSTRDLLQANPLAETTASRAEENKCVKPRLLTLDMWISDLATPEGSDFLVYSAPERLGGTTSTPSSLNNISAASILFNLALTHHLKAMSRPSPAAFATVTQLYKHTYRIAAQEPDTDRFLPLAILNNLAHVHYRMQNLADAERMCGLLWDAVLEAEKNDSGVKSLFEGFYTNVIHVTFRCSQSAAAA
jgi:hypothetical protein